MLGSKVLRVWFAATLLTCVFSRCEALSAQEKPHFTASSELEYRIHAGDVVKLDVWKHPEITRTIPVDQKGNIQLPGIHNLKAAGLTAMELAVLIRQKLEGLVPNPQVTVTVTDMSNPSTLPPQAMPRVPVHPYQSPSPDLRPDCCVADLPQDSLTRIKS